MNYTYIFKKTKNNQETSNQAQDKNQKELLEEESCISIYPEILLYFWVFIYKKSNIVRRKAYVR